MTKNSPQSVPRPEVSRSKCPVEQPIRGERDMTEFGRQRDTTGHISGLNTGSPASEGFIRKSVPNCPACPVVGRPTTFREPGEDDDRPTAPEWLRRLNTLMGRPDPTELED